MILSSCALSCQYPMARERISNYRVECSMLIARCLSVRVCVCACVHVCVNSHHCQGACRCLGRVVLLATLPLLFWYPLARAAFQPQYITARLLEKAASVVVVPVFYFLCFFLSVLLTFFALNVISLEASLSLFSCCCCCCVCFCLYPFHFMLKLWLKCKFLHRFTSD